MQIIALDFETYFDTDYSLRNLTTEAYVRDDRFEALVLGARSPDGWYNYHVGENNINSYLASIDWSNTAALAHHAHFDGLILSHHFDTHPVFWFDTLSMARLLIGNHLSASLDSLSKHYRLSGKTVPYDLFKGKHVDDLDLELLDKLGEGCVQDVRLMWDIFKKLSNNFPESEYQLVDLTVKMFTEPKLIGNEALFRSVAQEEMDRKEALLSSLGITKKDLSSTPKFKKLLELQGLEVETKPGKNGPIPALAKPDEFFKSLLEHDNPIVSELAEARLNVKSTINETRAGRLADMSSRGPLPVYLSYCGAHTTRWSGGDKVNFQNLPSIRSGNQIRKGIIAPPGYMLAILDFSQIECRLLNYLAGQTDVVEAFREGRDLYSEGAARFYGYEIVKGVHKLERHLGKVLELGCGYGMGALRLQATCKAGALGGPPIVLDDAQALLAIQSYRQSHQQVTGYWTMAGRMLKRMRYAEEGEEIIWGPFKLQRGRVILPNGAPMIYELRFEEGQFERRTRRGWTSIWGGGLTENLVQGLARVVFSEALIRVVNAGFTVALHAHDELVVLIENDDPTETVTHLQKIMELMRQLPNWLPDFPLEVEGHIAKEYEK